MTRFALIAVIALATALPAVAAPGNKKNEADAETLIQEGVRTDAEDLLASALEGSDDPWVVRNRNVIKDSLEEVKTKIGSFEISGSPEGAAVLLSGGKETIGPHRK